MKNYKLENLSHVYYENIGLKIYSFIKNLVKVMFNYFEQNIRISVNKMATNGQDINYEYLRYDEETAVLNIWLMAALTMIFFMQSGFALLECGAVRLKNA